MAVTWEVKIDVLNLAEKRVRVTATRTDDIPDPPEVFSYSLETIVDENVMPLAETQIQPEDILWLVGENQAIAKLPKD